jgi:hypothetical protein
MFLGNTQATDSHGHNHGVNEVGATMHWGPDASHNRFSLTHGKAYVQVDQSFLVICFCFSICYLLSAVSFSLFFFPLFEFDCTL